MPPSDPPSTPPRANKQSTAGLVRVADARHALVQQFRLLVTQGPDAGKSKFSSGERTVIGTDDTADLKLDDPTVSHFHVELVLLKELPDVIRDARRKHALLLQRPQAFKNDRDCHYRAADDRPHEPTAGLDDLEHERPVAPSKSCREL